MASAAAKSLRARAACRCSSASATRPSVARGQPVVAPRPSVHCGSSGSRPSTPSIGPDRHRARRRLAASSPAASAVLPSPHHLVDGGDAPPACPGRRPGRRGTRRTSIAARRSAPDALRRAPDERLDPPVRRARLGQRRVGELDHRPVVRRHQVVAQLDRAHRVGPPRRRARCCPATCSSSRRRGSPSRCAASTGRSRRRPPATGPARSRGAGSAGPARRRGCRTRRRGSARPSRSTPGASRAGRGPRGSARTPSPARRPCAPSRARSRGGRACGRRCRCRPAGCRSSSRWPVSAPYSRERPDVEVHVAVDGVGVARARSAAPSASTISGTCPVARGSYVGGRKPRTS